LDERSHNAALFILSCAVFYLREIEFRRMHLAAMNDCYEEFIFKIFLNIFQTTFKYLIF